MSNAANLRQQKSRVPVFILSMLLAVVVGCVQIFFLIRVVSGLSVSTAVDYWIAVFVAFFFFLFSLFFVIKNIAVMFYAFIESSKTPEMLAFDSDNAPLVSVLIPCFNEQNNIQETIRSAINVNYPNLEVIVFDDGSNDETHARALEIANLYPDRVAVINQENYGKAAALNHAFKLSNGDYILSMDADSELEPESVARLVSKSIITNSSAVAGQVFIKNTHNLITYLQQLEYSIMNGTSRLFQSHFNNVLVGPGPITLFGRERLLKFMEFRDSVKDKMSPATPYDGPWESDTFAEDAKLSMGVLANGDKCVFEPAAECYTQAPKSIYALMNQRYRWVRGSIQAIKSTWRLWQVASHKKRSMSYWLIWFLTESIIWPVIDVFGVIIIILILSNSNAPLESMVWLSLLVISEIIFSIFAINACGGKKRISLLVPFYRLGYGILLQCMALFSFLDEFRKSKMRWN